MKALLVSTLLIIFITAQNTSSLCVKYNSMNGCESCEEKAYLFEDNKCRYTSGKEGCAVYTVTQMKITCAQCLEGYYQWEQGCKKLMPNCLRQNQSRCLQCGTGYKLAGNECISLTSQPALPAHCTELSPIRLCSACSLGYSLKKQQCILTSLVCNLTQIFKGCLFTEKSQCVTCKPNYMLTSGRCKQITLPYCLLVNNSACIRCDLYYTLVNGNCVNEYSKSIQGCLRSESMRCVECVPGWTLTTGNGSCVRVGQVMHVRSLHSFIVYTMMVTRVYSSNRWYIYCTSFQSGICKSCEKSYILNSEGECVKDLSLMKKFSLISVSTSFLNTSFSEYWQFDSTQISTSNRQIWYQMTSTSLVTLWGISLKAQSIFSAKGLFLVYQTQTGEWVCFNNCRVQPLSWTSNNLFQWVFTESIRTKSIRIYFLDLVGKVPTQVEGYYEDPLSADSDLVSVWPSATLHSSARVSSTFDYKLSQVSVSGGLSLQIVSLMYAGFSLNVEGVVRVRRVIVSAGASGSWITSFILKYSLDGVNFYCVDGCTTYNGVSSSSEFTSIRIKNPVYSRYMILIPITYKTGVSLRFDFLYDSSLNLAGCSSYFNDGKCKQCKSDYDLSNGVCKIKFSPVPFCKTMNTNNGNCLLCQDGYYLNSFGKCPLKLAGCIYTGSQCTSCIEGYSYENNVCTIPSQYLLRMSLIGVKLYSSVGAGSSPLFTDDCQGKGGWIPRITDTQQWVIMSTSDTLKIYKIVITPGSISYLQSFHLFYSNDMSTWTQYTSPILFSANTQSNQTIIQLHLTPYITAKSIKIVPLKWGSKGINFNFEAYYYYHKSRGQYYDKNNLTFKSFNDLADVFFSQKVVITEMNTRIGDNGCFTLPSTPNQYLLLSLDEFEDEIADVTTMYVRGSNLRKAWVKSLYFMFSKNYGKNFVCYKNCTPIVTGLTGPDDLKTFELEGMDNVTDIKVYPVSWEGANSIRIEFAIK